LRNLGLFNLRSERDSYHEIGEYVDMDNNENYFRIGIKILDILTNELNINYSIIDYTKKPAANRGTALPVS